MKGGLISAGRGAMNFDLQGTAAVIGSSSIQSRPKLHQPENRVRKIDLKPVDNGKLYESGTATEKHGRGSARGSDPNENSVVISSQRLEGAQDTVSPDMPLSSR